MPRQRITPLSATCQCGCGESFKPATRWQRFTNEQHRRGFWKHRKPIERPEFEALKAQVETLELGLEKLAQALAEYVRQTSVVRDVRDDLTSKRI